MRQQHVARTLARHLVAPRAARRVGPVIIRTALGLGSVAPVPIIVRPHVGTAVAQTRAARPRTAAVAAAARVLVVSIAVVVVVVVVVIIPLPPACPTAVAVAVAMVVWHRRLGSLVAGVAVGQVRAGLCTDHFG